MQSRECKSQRILFRKATVRFKMKFANGGPQHSLCVFAKDRIMKVEVVDELRTFNGSTSTNHAFIALIYSLVRPPLDRSVALFSSSVKILIPFGSLGQPSLFWR